MRFLPSRGHWLKSRKPPEGQWEWQWTGAADASVLVAGHSHRESYRRAIAEGLTSSGAAVAVLAPSGSFDPAAAPNPDDAYWRAACAAHGRVLAVTWQGNQYNTHFLFGFDEPFRLHDHGESGMVVPASMLSAVWRRSFEGIDAAVASARAEHVVLIGTPPPKSDEAVREGLPHSPFFVRALARVGESVETIRITPAAVRVGLWKVLQDDLEREAARIGAVFVPVPPATQTADGCLKPEYAWPDVSHANSAFAALMLGEIEAAVA